MDLRYLLESHLKKKNVKPVFDEAEKARQDDESDKLFEKYYEEWKGISQDQKWPCASYDSLPKFYHKVPSEENPLRLKLREESRAAFLQQRSTELLDNDELKEIYILLETHQSAPMGTEPMIHYEDFLKVSELAGAKSKPYFRASTFCKFLGDDPLGRISIVNFFNYVMRKVWLYQTRVGLSLYDASGQGFLKETDLENYILDLIPTLPQLKDLEKSFHPFYVCTVVRKFFFFLDSLHTGRIKIQDILVCSFLDDLLELRDNDLPKSKQQSNWFSAQSALRVYGLYLNLDKDHNGMLSKSELMKYGMETLTPVFIERVFQECLTYDGEMDYKTYLNFILALENKKEPQALHYFFKILDINGEGYLTTFSLNYFFRSILEQLRQRSHEPVNFEDVKDEIFDMVKPIHPSKITLHDLISCGCGEIVVNILIDLNGFWMYETRELPFSENSEDVKENPDNSKENSEDVNNL